MKRLKFSCPFGGKQYPWIVAGCAAFIMPFVLLSFDLSVSLTSMIWAPICILVICFFIEQHLTPEDLECIAEAEQPLWQPVSQEVINRFYQTEPDRMVFKLMRIGIYGVCALPISLYFVKNDRLIPMVILLVIGTIAAVVVMTLLSSDMWSRMDETAVYFDVPIHHIYDMEYTRRFTKYDRRLERFGVRPLGMGSNIRYNSYLVFYLPDGRYILRISDGDGGKKTVRIIRFKGAVRWMLV